MARWAGRPQVIVSANKRLETSWKQLAGSFRLNFASEISQEDTSKRELGVSFKLRLKPSTSFKFKKRRKKRRSSFPVTEEGRSILVYWAAEVEKKADLSTNFRTPRERKRRLPL